MPLLSLLGMLLIYAVISIYESVGTVRRPFTKDELDAMSREMVGKSQQEAREIFKKYR